MNDDERRAREREWVKLVRSVPLSAIAEQRDARPSWPDFHPEDFCHRCGHRNISWYVDSNLWNEAWLEAEAEGGYQSVLCVACFAELWEKATGLRMAWDLRPSANVLLSRLRNLGGPVTPAAAPGPAASRSGAAGSTPPPAGAVDDADTAPAGHHTQRPSCS